MLRKDLAYSGDSSFTSFADTHPNLSYVSQEKYRLWAVRVSTFLSSLLSRYLQAIFPCS